MEGGEQVESFAYLRPPRPPEVELNDRSYPSASLKFVQESAEHTARSLGKDCPPIECAAGVWRVTPVGLGRYPEPLLLMDLSVLRLCSEDALRFMTAHEMAHLTDQRVVKLNRFAFTLVPALATAGFAQAFDSLRSLWGIAISLFVLAAVSGSINNRITLQGHKLLVLAGTMSLTFAAGESGLRWSASIAFVPFLALGGAMAGSRWLEYRADRIAALTYPSIARRGIAETMEYLAWVRGAAIKVQEQERQAGYPAGRPPGGGVAREMPVWLSTHPTAERRRAAVERLLAKATASRD